MYQILVVHRQENNSFANFGSAMACVVCKCVVLCVGCSLYRFSFLSFSRKLSAVVVFYTYRYRLAA